MPIYKSAIPTLTDREQVAELCNINGRKLVEAVLADGAGGIAGVNTGEYETVAAGQSDQILGAAGAVGDWLERVICIVATAATSTVSIKDGNGSAISLLPANTAIGTYSIPIGMKAVNATTPGWKVTTGAGVSVIGVGNFT